MNNSKTQINWGQLSNIIRRGHCDINGVEKNFVIENDNILIKEIEITEAVAITQPLANTKKHLFIFKDCIFLKSFLFSNFSNINSLRFINCEFKEEFNIIEFPGNLQITEKCIFHKDCLTQLSNGVLEIVDITFNNNLFISGVFHTLNLIDINVPNDDNKSSSNIFFKQSEIKHSNFENVYFNSISFSNNCALLFEGNFTSVKCSEFSINQTTIGHLIHLMACTIDTFIIDNVVSGNPSHRYLKISGKSNISKASIALHMLESTEIDNSSFSEIKLWGYNSASSIFKISGCELGKFILTDVQNRGVISMRNIILKKDEVIGFIESDLGKMDFIRCDFSKGTLDFQNSKIMETFIAETDFPKKVISCGKRSPSQAQLAFGQLQTAFQKQGDTVRSFEYHSREIEAHFNNIKFISKDFFTKFNLSMNLISSYFGRWWWLGVVFTFTIGLIFFCLLLGSTNEFNYSYSLTFDSSFSDSFLKFMNPLRHFETETIFSNHEAIHTTKLSYFIDFCGRVFVTFGYYQTIQAFRRYGRK